VCSRHAGGRFGMQEYRRFLGRSLSAALLATLLIDSAFSQSGAGSVRGTVRDPTEAVIPGAKVRLANTATNVVAETTSNEAGFYVFPVVVPGRYELSVESPALAQFQ